MVDHALKVFGTPERELRRRWLHPLGFPASWFREETDDSDKLDSQPSPHESATSSPPVVPQASPQPYTSSKTDRAIGLLFHLTASAFFLYMMLDIDKQLTRIKQDKGLVIPASETYGGRWKFFTSLNFHAQTGYFILALLCDLLPWERKEIQKFLDFIFTTTIFPCAMMVVSMFWIFTTFLREFSVGPDGSAASEMLDALPPQVNHVLHTAVGFAVVLEVLLVYHRYPSSSDGIKTMFIWNSSYAFWIYWCYYQGNTLPYPLFENLGPYLMPLAFTLFFFISVLSYFFGKTLTSWSWAD